MSAPGGIALDYTYDGYLKTGATWSGPVEGSLEIGYNGDFRPATIGVNGSDVISLEYDPDGLLTRVGSLILTRRAENALLTEASVGNLTTAWTYNEFLEATDRETQFNGSPLWTTSNVRDALGRLTRSTETIFGETHVQEYAYDLVGRLQEVRRDGQVVASLEYDANGNRLRVTRPSPSGDVTGTYDEQDRLLTFGAATYTYNPAGELETKVVGSETTSYRYDAVGNLLGVTLPDGTAIAYLVDPKGRRIGKRVNGTLVQGFLYQAQLLPVVELDGSGGVVSRFVYGGIHRNVPEYMVKGGVTYRLLTDHLGSVRLVVNSSTGEIAQRLDYDESGRVILNTDPGFQPFGFAGGLYDEDTGLVHFNARDYDPQTGRWRAKDPAGFIGGPNLYEYVGGDPINRADPSGLCENGLSNQYAPNGPKIILAALESGEWEYSQGKKIEVPGGIFGPLPFEIEGPPRNTHDKDTGPGQHIGDCTDLVYWVAADVIDGWRGKHPYWDEKVSTGLLASLTPEDRKARGWKKIERDAVRRGDIFVRGGHAGIYMCTDSECQPWGWANDGMPITSPSGYSNGDTGWFDDFTDGTLFFRPVDP